LHDILTFAELTGDLNPLHVDPGYAEKTPFRRPIAHGLLALAVGAGLGSLAPECHEVVLVSIDQWRFCRPVYPGDLVYLVNEVVAVNGSSRRRGSVSWSRQLFNQDHELVQSGLLETLVAKRSRQRVRRGVDTGALVRVADSVADKLPAYPR
jgi:acyl dehydratase